MELKAFEPTIKLNVIKINVMMTFLIKKIEWEETNVSFQMSSTIV